MTEIKNIYVFDTGSFVLLGKLPQDIVPFIWEGVAELIREQRLLTHFEVKEELLEYHREDSIKIWIQEMEKRYEFIMPPSLFQARKTAEIHEKYPYFVDTDTDKPDADPCLIVQMLELKQAAQSTLSENKVEYYLVTEEHESSERKNFNNPVEVTKIPDFCKVCGINFLDFWGMARQEKWQWKK